MYTYTRVITGLVMAGSLLATTAAAQERSGNNSSPCRGLPSHSDLRDVGHGGQP
jgi:hypothetical protein